LQVYLEAITEISFFPHLLLLSIISLPEAEGIKETFYLTKDRALNDRVGLFCRSQMTEGRGSFVGFRAQGLISLGSETLQYLLAATRFAMNALVCLREFCETRGRGLINKLLK
jgi:hypothetical protein